MDIVNTSIEKCEICLNKDANYTCPQCKVRICSLVCVRQTTTLETNIMKNDTTDVCNTISNTNETSLEVITTTEESNLKSDICCICSHRKTKYNCPKCKFGMCSLACAYKATLTTVKKSKECEVCKSKEAKYTCPKCEVRTCSLACVNIHKKELPCDGIRDKTKFIPIDEFTDLDLLSDYRLLESIGRSVDQFKKNPCKIYTRERDLPHHLYKLKSAALERGTFLHLMPHNFKRHKENTTYLNFKTRQIFWRIEWIFPQAENVKWITKRVEETERISNILEQIWDPLECKDGDIALEKISTKLLLKDRLQFYYAAGLSNIRILLKAEKVTNSDSRFHELDATLTFRENFEKKNIIEFPSIYVVLRDHSAMYNIISSDDESCATTEKPEKKCFRTHKRYRKDFNRHNGKQRYDNKQIKKEKKSVVNYFFNEASNSEDEDVNVKEKEVICQNIS